MTHPIDRPRATAFLPRAPVTLPPPAWRIDAPAMPRRDGLADVGPKHGVADFLTRADLRGVMFQNALGEILTGVRFPLRPPGMIALTRRLRDAISEAQPLFVDVETNSTTRGTVTALDIISCAVTTAVTVGDATRLYEEDLLYTRRDRVVMSPSRILLIGIDAGLMLTRHTLERIWERMGASCADFDMLLHANLRNAYDAFAMLDAIGAGVKDVDPAYPDFERFTNHVPFGDGHLVVATRPIQVVEHPQWTQLESRGMSHHQVGLPWGRVRMMTERGREGRRVVVPTAAAVTYIPPGEDMARREHLERIARTTARMDMTSLRYDLSDWTYAGLAERMLMHEDLRGDCQRIIHDEMDLVRKAPDVSPLQTLYAYGSVGVRKVTTDELAALSGERRVHHYEGAGPAPRTMEEVERRYSRFTDTYRR